MAEDLENERSEDLENERWWNNLYKRHPYYITDNKIKFYKLINEGKRSVKSITSVNIKSPSDIKEFMEVNFQALFDQKFIDSNLDIFFPYIYSIHGNRKVISKVISRR